jgi:thiamine monophosphate synthase
MPEATLPLFALGGVTLARITTLARAGFSGAAGVDWML